MVIFVYSKYLRKETNSYHLNQNMKSEIQTKKMKYVFLYSYEIRLYQSLLQNKERKLTRSSKFSINSDIVDEDLQYDILRLGKIINK